MDGVKPFTDDGNEWEKISGEVSGELDQINHSLSEIELLLEQSQIEVSKLAQRNASVTARLQQLHNDFDIAPRDEVRAVYDSALEIQQRLFVARGQVEKLQSDHANQQRVKKLLEKVSIFFEKGNIQDSLRGTVRPVSVDLLENIIQAQESERQRLSRLMHDGPAQAMANFILQTDIAMRLFDMDLEKARGELAGLKTASTTTFKKVREFIFELRPMMLDDLGLVPTVRRYIEALQEQTGAMIHFTFSGVERRLESYLEILIFRAIQELLGNAVHNSNASQIKVQFDMAETLIKVIVDDNGKGFDIVGLPESDHLGYSLIHDRVKVLGGDIQVDSKVGHGTRITMQIPATNIAAIA